MESSCRPQLYEQYFDRICIVIMIVIALLFANSALFPKTANAQSTLPANYSCGNLSSNHCIAYYQWVGPMYGAQVNIGVPFLTSINTDGFSDWEYWVAQFNNPSCSGTQNNCWIEAGITTTSGTIGGGTYFWSDSRPNGGYHDHYPFTVGPDDINITFQIYQVNSTTWNVSGHINNCGYPNSCTPDWTQQSTANNYVPRIIQIGMELAGTYGQPSIGSDWTNNYYRCGAHWCPQASLGSAGSTQNVKTPPMTGYWVTRPSSSSTGDWFAYCSSC